MDLDIPCYDASTKTFFGNPEAYAAKFPTSWEANMFKEGKYPPLSSFVPATVIPRLPALPHLTISPLTPSPPQPKGLRDQGGR